MSADLPPRRAEDTARVPGKHSLRGCPLPGPRPAGGRSGRDPLAHRRRFAAALAALAVLCAGAGRACAAPTLWGYTGLINIPTADLPPDGHAVLGTGYLKRPYGLCTRPGHDNATYYASLSFLPFLEVTLRVTRFRGANIDHLLPAYGSDKDRSMGVRLRLLGPGHGRAPDVVVGVHDPALGELGLDELSNSGAAALYVVASKRLGRAGWHAGYAVDGARVGHTHFSGLFGGVEVAATRWLSAMAEYDTHKISAGLRGAVALPRWPGTTLGVHLVTLGMKEAGGGAYLELGL